MNNPFKNHKNIVVMPEKDCKLEDIRFINRKGQKTTGPNMPCPCGSKKEDGTPIKYKKCCMWK